MLFWNDFLEIPRSSYVTAFLTAFVLEKRVPLILNGVFNFGKKKKVSWSKIKRIGGLL